MNIVFQTANWGIVDKPAGLSCHNDPSGQDLQGLLSKALGGSIHLVQRLDQETSGLLVFSQSAEMVPVLQAALQAESSLKRYVCLLRGQLQFDGHWTNPLSDKAEGRRNPAGQTGSQKACLTQARTLKTNKYFTLMECILGTGRQHQIRKHAAINKHALVGDNRYGEAAYNQRIQGLYQNDRLFLHCQKIMLHLGDKEIVVESPLPPEFEQLVS